MRSTDPDRPPRLYHELASWFHLLTAPADYAYEAAFYAATIRDVFGDDASSVLELGSGGGNNASHMKRDFAMTLTDRSQAMLALSRRLNPECEHAAGDMRELRLGRRFDAVFLHDAVMYMTDERDLLRALETAYAHTAAGGMLLVAPDCVRETFRPATTHGGHDGSERALRYLQWTWDPDPDDSVYTVDFVYVLREGLEPPRLEHDRHLFGIFARDTWLRLLRQAGYHEVESRPSPHWEGGPDQPEVFVGVR